MGNAKGHRRRFGSIRELASGQWQARYRGPDGIMRPADRTFPTKTEAERWLTRTEADVLNDEWTNPEAGLISFEEFATSWIEERPNLRPKTAENYRYVLANQLTPALGSRAIAEIKERNIRRWRKNLLDGGVSVATAAKAYRLLKAIMNTAVDDGLILGAPAGSRALRKTDRRSGRYFPCSRYSPSLMSFIPDTAHSSCSPSSGACDGASWPRCAAWTPIWPHGRSGSSERSPSYAATARCSVRPRPMPGTALSPSQTSSCPT
jgi:Phage integrase, N-terminal SAM-like domain